ncbi:MAG: hypothetical protein HDT42_06355 [Ruminococcaceae bacterium]|nr:hypothetical protein [Oscillospiraceae bacterium]
MGFVQLSDDLTNWEWLEDKNTVYVYIRLLLAASWGEKDYKGVHLQRGQLIISQREFAEKCGMSRQELRTILDRLIATHKITQTSTHKFSLITLIEYDCATQPPTRSAPEKQPTINPPTLLRTNIQNIKQPNNALAREGGGLNSSFEKFWAAYPKKTAKQNALKCWIKLNPNEELTAKILASLEQQKRSVQWTKDNGQFIPYPATWLNGKRWEDELQEVNENGKHNRDISSRSKSDWLAGFE